ncbi:MAG: hypothetical protein RIE08_00060 [Acidimicrobiales bacterium]
MDKVGDEYALVELKTMRELLKEFAAGVEWRHLLPTITVGKVAKAHGRAWSGTLQGQRQREVFCAVLDMAGRRSSDLGYLRVQSNQQLARQLSGQLKRDINHGTVSRCLDRWQDAGLVECFHREDGRRPLSLVRLPRLSDDLVAFASMRGLACNNVQGAPSYQLIHKLVMECIEHQVPVPTCATRQIADKALFEVQRLPRPT